MFEGTPVLGRFPSFLEFCSRFKKKFYVTRESLHFCGIQISPKQGSWMLLRSIQTQLRKGRFPNFVFKMVQSVCI